MPATLTPRRTVGTRLAAMAAVLLTASAIAAVPGPAEAAGPGQGAGGGANGAVYVSVSVRFSGDAAPGGGGTVRVQVKASCWWSPADDGPYTDAVAMLAYYDAQLASGNPDYVYGVYGPRSAFEAAAASATPMHWYRATCVDPALYVDYTGSSVNVGGMQVAVLYHAFQATNGVATPPAPLVAPRDLAEAARDQMVLPLPQVERNPRTASIGGGTLVGLPTWFWVLDPAAVGGTTGRRTIRAEVAGGTVWAQVVADTAGLSLGTPVGTTTCPPARAVLAWSPGLADTAGCTVTFPRASVGYPGGYPVSATAAWQLTWTGSEGTAGALPGMSRVTTSQVPVAEAQALVGPHHQ